MFPYIRVPTHITGLYIFTVANFLALFHITIVQGDVLVIAQDTNVTIHTYADMIAGFGPPRFPPEGLEGFLVYAQPADACSEIAKPPSPSNHSVNWIVLIRREGCNFDHKVEMAEKAGYSAAIVHNIGSNDLETMGSDSGLIIGIPSVFIGADDAYKLKTRYTYDKGYFVLLNNVQEYQDVKKYLIAFACIMGIILLTTVTTLIVRFIKDRRRRRRRQLSPQHLKKLPIKKFQKGDQYDTCAVCLEEYMEGEKLRVLPCAHAYHIKCIDPWLSRSRRTCPVCKRKVFPGGTGDSSDSDDSSDEDEYTPLLRNSGRPTTSGNTFAQPDANSRPPEENDEIDDVEQSNNAADVVVFDTTDYYAAPSTSGSINVDQDDVNNEVVTSVDSGPIEIGIEASSSTVQSASSSNKNEMTDHERVSVV